MKAGARRECYLPIPPHPPGDLITPALRLHEDDGLVLLLAHDLLQETQQSAGGVRLQLVQYIHYN